jgi:phosphoenolpyruvate phosphomutase
MTPVQRATATRARRLREILESPELEFLCEAHNGLSAKIVEEAGFKGIWASGFAMSAALGVRDNNETSWTQVLEAVEFMAEATSIPVLLDGDTGYGNFNNVRRLTRKLVARGIGGVCLEDKLFPKTNSFLRDDRQPLADVDEFTGKIKAAKDAQGDPDFCVIARVEALIAGWGLGEALRRAEAYRRAGADGILIHSRSPSPAEVLAFKREWADRSPVVIVPTKYYATPTEVFRQAGFSIVIWANALVRSSVAAMQQTAGQLAREQALLNIEDRVVPVAEIFRLQGDDELQEAEERYLPGSQAPVSAVILAASRGDELGDLTQNLPKALIPVSGRPLLYRQVDTLNELGVKRITVVRGFGKDLIDAPNLRCVDNDEYATTKEVVSLAKGLAGAEGTTLVAYGDILYKKYIPELLLQHEDDFVLAVDSDWAERHASGGYGDFVRCDQAYRKELFNHHVTFCTMGAPGTVPPKDITGEWIGLAKLSPRGVAITRETLASMAGRSDFGRLRLADLFNALSSAGHRIRVQYVRGHWLDIDDFQDLNKASVF